MIANGAASQPTATGELADFSIFNWYTPLQWSRMMLESIPVCEIFAELPDFEFADKHALQTLFNPWNVTLKKSKHAGEGLPRQHVVSLHDLYHLQACGQAKLEKKWWNELFEHGFIHESLSVLRDRRFIVKSHMIAMFSLIGDGFGRLRVDDFYHPMFWLEILINMKSKAIVSICGRHAEALTCSFHKNIIWNVQFHLLASGTLPRFRANISQKNLLNVWDEASETSAFEIVCDLDKFFKLLKI